MARNAVQFQKGLSMAEFVGLYGSEDQCHAALVQMRWPDGLKCPKCGAKRHSYLASKRLFQCTACRVQTSARSGSIDGTQHLFQIAGEPMSDFRALVKKQPRRNWMLVTDSDLPPPPCAKEGVGHASC